MTLTDTQTRSNGATAASTAQPTTSQPGKALTLREAVEDFSGQLSARREEYAPALPSHITPERFQRVAVTAVNLNPELLHADRRSLLNACAKAASDGLLPDGRDGAFVIFNTKDGDKWIKKVQWMPMVAGIIKKARQSGEIAAMGARIVYTKEIEAGKFTHKVVDGVPKVDHEPILFGERGTMALVYSFVQFKDGSTDFEFLHADDIKKIRGVSKAKFGPWFDWEEEMWKKSAIRRHAKRLPLSSELFDTIARDDEMTEFERQRRDAEQKMLGAARAQLGAPREEAQPMDNGEVIEGDLSEAEDEDEQSDAAGPLDDMESELLALANCISVASAERLEKEVGQTLIAEPDKLQAWSGACYDRIQEIMAKGGKKK